MYYTAMINRRAKRILLASFLAALLAVPGFLGGLLGGFSVTPAVADSPKVELIMFEKDGCPWCTAWHNEIGEAYPNTWEGRSAPLRQIDIHAPRPEDLAGVKSGRYTPTFVLLVDGVEKGRIRGYPGADFFWPLLDDILTEAGMSEATAPN